jgi:hypothetical protein
MTQWPVILMAAQIDCKFIAFITPRSMQLNPSKTTVTQISQYTLRASAMISKFWVKFLKISS